PNQFYNGNSWRKTGSQLITVYSDGPWFDAQSRPEWDALAGTSGPAGVNPAAPSVAVAAGAWRKEVFDLSAYKSTNLRVRFRVKSNSTAWFGWLVDNISIAEAPTPITGTRQIGGTGYANFAAAA